jgi:hypothetical protein
LPRGYHSYKEVAIPGGGKVRSEDHYQPGFSSGEWAGIIIGIVVGATGAVTAGVCGAGLCTGDTHIRGH